MSRHVALLDANVLYPAPMRDLLMQLAVADVFRARWTADIHREWIEALLRREPHRDRAMLERTRDLMDRATRDSLIAGYDELIPSLFADHHLVVAPYRDATASGVVPLAHAAGRPVVVTPVGGLPESVADGIDGIVATDTSAEALGAAIDRALADLDELAVGAASRQLGWRAVADALTTAVD